MSSLPAPCAHRQTSSRNTTKACNHCIKPSEMKQHRKWDFVFEKLAQ